MLFRSGEPFELNMISKAIIPILYTGVMSLGVANFCQFAGQRKVTPAVAAIVCSFESVCGLLFGILLLNETMTIMKLAWQSSLPVLFFIAPVPAAWCGSASAPADRLRTCRKEAADALSQHGEPGPLPQSAVPSPWDSVSSIRKIVC